MKQRRRARQERLNSWVTKDSPRPVPALRSDSNLEVVVTAARRMGGSMAISAPMLLLCIKQTPQRRETLTRLHRHPRKTFRVAENNTATPVSRLGNRALQHRAVAFWIFLVACCTTAQAQNATGRPENTTDVLVSASAAPTVTPPRAVPSKTPTVSPSSAPVTMAPTSSFSPTMVPTLNPSYFPSANPTSSLMTAKANYRQSFVVLEPGAFFNESEQIELADIFMSYTTDLIVDEPVMACANISEPELDCIFTTCVIERQSAPADPTTNATTNDVDYVCEYAARLIDPIAFPERFRDFVNQNDVARLTRDMEDAGLNVVQAFPTEIYTVSTLPPTVSPVPSVWPSWAPSSSSAPSALQPSLMPSSIPSPLPTDPPDPPLPPTAIPSPAQDPNDGKTFSVGVIASIVIVGGLAMMLGLFLYYRSWKKSRDEAPPYRGSGFTSGGDSHNRLASFRHRVNQSSRRPADGPVVGDASHHEDDDTGRNVVLSPTDSLLSNKSMLSAGESVLGDESGDEADGTKNLQDEFDKYKDQNLEQLRTDVEDSLAGFEGIMSAAVTNALMGDEEQNVEMQELLWGCNPNPAGTEIEASALFEVSDWLKRNETSGGERKRAFMQEILNKMVTSVRYGVLRAEDGSRTIHESAAILGLKLAQELPMTTVIISGMRKTATAQDMIRALREFGDIDTAAVASGRRGFGIIRFRRLKSVDRALRRYRSSEIVIQDVAVQMKVLMPSGDVDGR